MHEQKMNSPGSRLVQAARKLTVLYPILLALFPVLGLYAYNIQEVPLSELIVPLVIVLASSLALFALAFVVLRNAHKAGLVVSLFVILFYSYGGIERLLQPRLSWDPKALLLPLWVLVF